MLKRTNHDLAAFQILKKQLDTLKAPKQLAIIRADGEYATNKNWDRYCEDEDLLLIANIKMEWLNGQLVCSKLEQEL